MDILNKPIKVIISFNETGDILPLWIGFEEDEAGALTYKVDEIISYKRHGINHVLFDCWISSTDRR